MKTSFFLGFFVGVAVGILVVKELAGEADEVADLVGSVARQAKPLQERVEIQGRQLKTKLEEQTQAAKERLL